MSGDGDGNTHDGDGNGHGGDGHAGDGHAGDGDGGSARHSRVLVIDDDLALQALFRAILGRSGFTVECARDGADGLKRLREAVYDAIILDLMMPNVSGFEVIAALENEMPDVLRSVIVATGAARRSVEKVDVAKVHALIRKPFDLTELVTTVNRCAARENTH
jgi:DNA-binding response OmpR family regulator